MVMVTHFRLKSLKTTELYFKRLNIMVGKLYLNKAGEREQEIGRCQVQDIKSNRIKKKKKSNRICFKGTGEIKACTDENSRL